jgi:hypothetical protein
MTFDFSKNMNLSFMHQIKYYKIILQKGNYNLRKEDALRKALGNKITTTIVRIF